MKKISTLLKSTLLGAALVLTVACGKTGGGDYRNLLPDDAFMTMSINGQSIMDKAGFSDAERAAVKGQAEMALMFMGGAISEDDKKFILSIIDSPDNSGISFKSDMYLSVSLDAANIDDAEAQVAFISKIGDSKKFNRLIELIKKLAPEVEIRSDRGLNVIVVEEGYYSTTVLAYNDTALVLYVHQGDYPATIAYVDQLFKGNNSLASNKDFSKFTNGKSDLGMLFNYGPVMDMLKDQIPGGIPYMNMLSSAYICTGTNFEKGKIDTDVNFIFTNDEAKKEFEDFYSKSKLNGKYAKYLSDNAIFAAASYLEGTKVYELLSKMPETSMITFIPEVKTILEAIDGEMFISLSDFGRHGVAASLLATVNDADVLGLLVDKIDGYADIVNNGDYYEIDIEGMEVAFGMKGDILFISTDSEILAALDGNSVNSPDNKIVSMFEKGYGAFYLDFSNLGEAILDNFWYGGYMDSETAMALEVLGLFKDMRMYIENDPTEAKMVIMMVDQDKNAMATIADKIREVAMNSMF